MNSKNFTFHQELVDDSEKLEKLIQTLKDTAPLVLGKKAISLDTEFIREKTYYPITALIQVATDKESWLIDTFTLQKSEKGKEILKKFSNLLIDNSILKILHAAQSDQECFYTLMNFTANPVFDIAVAASLCGLGDSPSLSKVLKEVCNVNLQKGYARADWTKRPLPEQLKKYAHFDVCYLIDCANFLISKLETQNRVRLACELSDAYKDPKIFAPTPHDLALRVMKNKQSDALTFSVLRELLEWREQKAQMLNIPRKWICDDDLLIALARTRPQDLDALKNFRSFSKSEIKKYGSEILNAITQGIAKKDISVPVAVEPIKLEKDEALIVDYLLFAIKVLAEKNKLSSKYISNSDLMVKLVKASPKTLEELESLNLIPKGYLEIIGQQIVDILQGKISIKIVQSKIEII